MRGKQEKPPKTNKQNKNSGSPAQVHHHFSLHWSSSLQHHWLGSSWLPVGINVSICLYSCSHISLFLYKCENNCLKFECTWQKVLQPSTMGRYPVHRHRLPEEMPQWVHFTSMINVIKTYQSFPQQEAVNYKNTCDSSYSSQPGFVHYLQITHEGRNIHQPQGRLSCNFPPSLILLYKTFSLTVMSKWGLTQIFTTSF